ncbi:MAG: hypothetical protein ACLQIB_44070 [Isosphaeraceae bacterium]
MSVYLFGKVFVDPAQIADIQRRMSSLAEEHEAGISFDSLDEDDQHTIGRLAGTGPGVAFSVTSRPGAGDASGLWEEAQRLALSLISEDRNGPLSVTPKSFDTIRWPEAYDGRMRKCRLGEVLDALARLPDYEKTCLTLVEGGIESLYEDRAERCIEAILRLVVLPWDCVSGVLYAWPNPSEFDRAKDVENAIGALQTLPP